MHTDNIHERTEASVSYGQVINEVLDSTKDVIRSEMNLFSSEFKSFLPSFTKHASQAAIFGAVLALSVLPFLAFLVIGLGELLDGRYWLSSLIVSIVCAVVGFPLCKSALAKIAAEDFKFTQTKESLTQALRTTKEKVEIVKHAAQRQGDHYDKNTFN